MIRSVEGEEAGRGGEEEGGGEGGRCQRWIVASLEGIVDSLRRWREVEG